MNQTQSLELEVICCTVEDAMAAHRGGATRLEVTVQLDQGGITPPLELVKAILQSVPVRARIMLRERADFAVNDLEELERLKRLARQLAALNINGLVVGFVRDGALDLRSLGAILAEAPSTRFTIHHALETTRDPLAALEAVRGLKNADRCLVHGGMGTREERVARLLQYRKALGPECKLILGGRVTLDTLADFARGTGLAEFHLGRAVRTPETDEGRVDADKVHRAMQILRSPCTS
ncbi:MAG: copper homeostasis protein CutC [Terriglobia bacterium]